MKYPFSPEVLDALPEELAELYRSLEAALLDEICSRMKLTEELNEVTAQDIRALRSHGISLEEIEKAVQRTANISQRDLQKLLDDVVERNQQYYREVIDLAGVTAPETLVSIEDTWAIYEQTKQTFQNLTRSTGFLVDNGRTMLAPARAYQWALDNAEMQVMSGAISYNRAIKSAVKQLADSGIKVVDYESGHRDQIDVAVRRATMTGVNQLCQKYAEQSLEYLETDLVEVSAHLGARNIGAGPENHESWQGGIYRWREKLRTSQGEYPDFLETTGYGTGPGLGGWNCRHHYHPFVEGVMEPTYSKADLDTMRGENHKFTFEGKEYDGYSASQKQRQIERTIRKLKREQTAFKAAGLTEDAQAVTARIRRLNKEYKAFSEAAELPLQRERMQVLYENNAPVQTAVPQTASASLERYTDVTAQWRETATPGSHAVQDLHEYTAKGVTYQVDGHNVVLDYSSHEKEIAELLEREVGGEIYMVPRVNNPQGVSTPDYLFRGKGYDLKTIGEKAGANTIFNRIKKAAGQAQSFVIDVTRSGLSDDTINQQIEKLFNRVDTDWVEEVIIIHDGTVVRVVKRA